MAVSLGLTVYKFYIELKRMLAEKYEFIDAHSGKGEGLGWIKEDPTSKIFAKLFIIKMQ